LGRVVLVMGSLFKARGPADDPTDAYSGVDPRHYPSVQGSQVHFAGFEGYCVPERRDEHEREDICICAWRWTRARKVVREAPKRLHVGRRNITLL
jgi:hypothetical protein